MLIDTIGIILYKTILAVCLYAIEKKKINLKDKNFYYSIILLNILSFILVSLDIQALNPWINLIILFIVDFFVLKNTFKKSILKVIIIYLCILISELFILILIAISCDVHNIEQLLKVMEIIGNSGIYSFIYNLVIIIILFFVTSNNFIYNRYVSMCNFIEKLKKRTLLTIVSIFFILVLTYTIFIFSSKVVLNIIMIILLAVIISIIYFRDLKVRFEYDETKEKYITSIQSLVEYEEMIDKYRVNNHENKNQLLTIQNMINHKDPKVNDYIDNLVGNVYMTNEKTMMDVSIIPAGGLRATIHTKLNIMDNKKIKYVLNIDRKLRTIDFDNISLDLNLKICKVVSIFIDNAIDEVDTHKKNKIVNIEMFLDDDKLIIEVSNKFKNNLDLNRIYEKKYTTKSNGHGYGLPLAKELIDSDKSLNNYQKIEDDIFTQVLEIDIKK